MNTWKLCSLLFETSSNYESNLQTLLEHINTTPQKSLIVAPEVCLTGFDYDHFEDVNNFASYAIEEIKKVSTNKIIIVTIIEKRNGKIYNMAKIFYNGKVVQIGRAHV